ncbi:YveK family protein [Streptomyces lavendulae]|uniref:YveK family protein n=1 Tax=Streptomyces lavendulae TaxID=1914 RepID=UPI00368EBACE
MTEYPGRPRTGDRPFKKASPPRGGRRPGSRRSRTLWWPLPLCALCGLAAGWMYGSFKAPEYAATSYLVAVPSGTTPPATALGFAQAYARMATSDSTLAQAQPKAGIAPVRLRAQVHSEASPDSPVIAITGTSPSATGAADIANAVANALSQSSVRTTKNTGVQLLLLNEAVLPGEPSSPSGRLCGAVGLSAGALVGGLCLLAAPPRRQRPTEGAEGSRRVA